MRVGYARVSTQEQTLDSQTDALRQAGCERIYEDRISGTKSRKPEFELMMGFLRKGDTIVIWKLDRLGRSTRGLIELVEELGNKGIHLVSLNDPIDTTSPGGLLVFQIFCALAEHERNVIVQRTRAGLESARARGRKGGRPKGLAVKYQKMAPSVRDLYELGQQSTTQIMNSFQIGSRRTLYKILRHAGVSIRPVERSIRKDD
ncbi:recombinase family protein [Salmonirosea aquatica]|uniref:Resolvase n=1 Tax=Salmonirosea aquatica TaxID=2654236 RepID=A0A7C9FS89_9BACT|nr:resolvase [Cytophagaceae bacterium SJW1-29]MPR37169.1 resolvase [Cytophagaceae bacterium SJW1-29]MPR37183.1 resolvase [Cytophagaceae bacterium SJW1-29]MPR37383.1 resolvase [Cytophagaceae bacterium SJW1-29]